MIAKHSLLLAAALGFGWKAMAQTMPTLLWPSTFTGYERDIAVSLGYQVTYLDESDWTSYTAADFAAYDAVVIPGKGSCAISDIEFALDSRAQWSLAIGGNIFTMQISPQNQGNRNIPYVLVQEALAYVTSGSTTGLYASLDCYYQEVYSMSTPPTPTTVDLLDQFGTFAAEAPAATVPGCSSSAHVWSSAVAIADIEDTELSNWQCSISGVFNVYPTSTWQVEAIAVNARGSGTIMDMDYYPQPTIEGIPYILSRAAVSTGCGNLVVEPNYGEECDEGAAGDTLCSSECKCLYGYDETVEACLPEPVCGNGVLESGEFCDDGANNGHLYSACTSICTCANIDAQTEQCIVAADACGNGVYEPNTQDLEQCDNGALNGLAGWTCSSTCQCLYGVADASTGTCKDEPYCGNGVLEEGEECEDDLPKRRDHILGRYTFQGTATCTDTCQCRYGVLDASAGTCQPVPECLNGVVEDGEECEPAVDGDDVCSTSCTCIYGVDPTTGSCVAAPDPPATCGDGVLDSGEECDNALVGTSLCSSACTCIYGVDDAEAGTCLEEPTCGNGLLEVGEECDPYYTGRELEQREPISDPLCSSVCTCIYGYNETALACNGVPECGNGILESGEDCDAGTLNDVGGVCSSACTCILGMDETKACILPQADGTTTFIMTTSVSSTTTFSLISSSTSLSMTPSSSPVTTQEPTSSQAPVTSRSIPFSNSTTSSSSSSFSASSSAILTQTQSPPESSAPSPSALASGSVSVSSVASSPSATSTVDPLPAAVGVFSFLGCTGSEQNYPSFSLEVSSDDMDLEMCTSACEAHVYAGVHNTNCYCADNYDNVTTVARDLCSIPCPGNADEHCGGYRTVARLARRQATVPTDALLAIYINAGAVPAISTTVTTTAVSTSTSIQLGAANPTVTDTNTAAGLVTSLMTATATSVGTAIGTSTVCVGGYCNSGGYIFEICDSPAIGVIVFIPEPCSCRGGFSYVPANCTGDACAGQTVYACVPYTGGSGNDSTVVYQPQSCDHCSGGVTFVEAPPAANVTVLSSSGSGQETSPSAPTATGTFVVAAGASKIVAYFSSLALIVGAFAILL